MERLIDIKNFLIINVNNFDELLSNLQITLSHENGNYITALIITNIFGYMVIFLMLFTLNLMLKKVFKQRRHLI